MKKHLKKIGTTPGKITFTGDRKVENIGLSYIEYNESDLHEEVISNESITDFHSPNDDYVQWYDLRGLHDTRLIEEIGTLFGIHPLVLEDIADTHQRPKYEEYDTGIEIILKSFSFRKEDSKVLSEQITLFFFKGSLLSFQENFDDFFKNVRERLLRTNTRIRKKDTDYLAYALLDSIVDNYYITLDAIADRIEELEEEILTRADENSKSHIHHLKQEMLVMRKSIIPLREAINRFTKTENVLLNDDTGIFLRDLYNNIVQITDMVDTYRDTLSGLQDLYLSEISFRMNNVMQVLTIISVIFIPLTFLAGIYGMNFVNIPELKMHNGYYFLVAGMVLITGAQVLYFKRKRWL